MSISLREHLDSLNREVLIICAKKLGLPKGPARKAELIEHISRALATDLAGFLAHLTDPEKLLLAEAASDDGAINVAAFQAKHQCPCPLPVAYAYGPDREKTSVLNCVVHRGYDAPNALVQDLASPLRELLPKPAPPKIKTTELPPPGAWSPQGKRPPLQVHESERIAPAELQRVLRLAQAGKIKLAEKSQRPTDATTRAVSECLVVPDFDLEDHAEEKDQYYERAGAVRAHAWPVLLQQCGWARARGSQLTLTADGQRLLQAFDPVAYQAGVERFLCDNDFDELNRIPSIRGQSGKAKRYMSQPAERRLAIADALRDWPVGQWIGFDEAYRYLLASGHSFWVIREGLYLYFGELQYGHLSGSTSGINRQYLRALLGEPLATLGVVDIGYTYPHGLQPDFRDAWGTDDLWFISRYDGLGYIRLNPLGAFALGVTDAYQAPAPVRRELFRVLPNQELAIVRPHDLAASDRSFLELFASQRTDHVWAIDARRILDHLAAGGALAEIVSFLDAHAVEAVPEAVRLFLAELQAKLAAVKAVEDAVLVEWHDPAVAALIANDTAARKLCRQAGATQLAVPRRHLAAFRSALKNLGYILPAGANP